MAPLRAPCMRRARDCCMRVAYVTPSIVQLPHDTRVRLQGFVDAANNKVVERRAAEPGVAPAASAAKAGGGKRKKQGQGQGEKYKS